MSHAKLKILCDTTFEGFPTASTERFIKDAQVEWDNNKEALGHILWLCKDVPDKNMYSPHVSEDTVTLIEIKKVVNKLLN